MVKMRIPLTLVVHFMTHKERNAYCEVLVHLEPFYFWTFFSQPSSTRFLSEASAHLQRIPQYLNVFMDALCIFWEMVWQNSEILQIYETTVSKKESQKMIIVSFIVWNECAAL